jgi:hypothetical protein
MSKSDLSTKRLSAALLTGLLLINTCSPGFCQGPASTTEKKAAEKTSAGPAGASEKGPENDARSAADTVWSLDSKIEKKVEKDIENPTPTADPKLPSVDSILDSLNAQQNKSAAPADPNKPDPFKNLGPTPVDPASVLMKGNEKLPPTGSTASIAPATQNTAPAVQETVPGKTAAPAPNLSTSPGKGTTKLFGRIEQIAAEGDLKMPAMEMQKPSLDTRGKLLPGEIEKYSGTIAKSFPSDFRGVWGGNLQIWSYRYTPAYLAIDRAEATSSANVLKPQRSGAVNFNFYQDSKTGGIALEPANVLLSVPMKDTTSFKQMAGEMGGQMGGFASMFNQMAGNMEAPVVAIHFGKAEANSMERGISGNDFKQVVAKNVIRDLGPGVLEQQIVTKYVSKTQAGKVNSGYDESVMRFTKLPSGQLYVLCAAVKYSSSGKYLSKLIMYGNVDKNRRMQTNPYAQMNSMMGGMMNLGEMQKMMGGAAQRGGTIQVPHGGFGQMPGFGGFGGTGGGSAPAGGAGGLNDILKQLNQLQK